MSGLARRINSAATIAAVAVSLPPLYGILTAQMLTHMLVQIPLVFAGGVAWGVGIPRRAPASWLSWNQQGVPGLLFSALVLTYWMTPIALDHAAEDGVWGLAKIVSLCLAGMTAGISWRLGSVVPRLFYVGNMLWMMITVGMLYEESDQRLCNAYLRDDQVKTGQGLVALAILCACVVLVLAARNGMGNEAHSAVDR
jgi:hypothetical protein